MAAQIPERVKTFLEQPNLAALATQAPSGGVQVTPVWFLATDGHILINTKVGRVKLRNIKANPRVALAIVDRENPYRYVQIQGTVAHLDAANGARDIDRLSQRYAGKPYTYPADDHPRNRISIYIAPEKISTMGI